MKLLIPILIFALLSLSGCETTNHPTKYEDRPIGVTQDGISSFEELMDHYSAIARDELDHFREEFKNPGSRKFFVITRVYEAERFEQIYVEIEEVVGGVYKGLIRSTPTGGVEFREGDEIEVLSEEVVDWLIMSKDGEEEGNLTGKVIDALQVGLLSFIVEMTPVDGVFKDFEVVSVLNSRTQQEVIEITNAEIREKVAQSIARIHAGNRSEDGKPRYAYSIVSFPKWEIMK